MKRKWISLLLTFLAMVNSLKGEVEQVIITWNAFKCQNTCVTQLEQSFAGIKEVTDLKLDPQSGSAIMKWDPRYPFSYEPFRYAAARIGLYIRSMHVRVRGTVVAEGTHFYLISIRDQTRFLLIGPAESEPGRYIPRNIEMHPLTTREREKLLYAERNKIPIIILGPLFIPSYHPLTLVIEEIKFPKDPRNQKP